MYELSQTFEQKIVLSFCRHLHSTSGNFRVILRGQILRFDLERPEAGTQNYFFQGWEKGKGKAHPDSARNALLYVSDFLFNAPKHGQFIF
jgi:hypothetical protein